MTFAGLQIAKNQSPSLSTGWAPRSHRLKRMSGIWYLISGAWAFYFIFFTSLCHAQTIRVAVLQNASECSLTIRGAYSIFSIYSSEVLSQGSSLKGISVAGTPIGIRVGEEELAVFGVTIRPENQQKTFIVLNGRQFRGRMDIYRQQDQTLLVVNQVDIEDYLQGVLYHEVSHRWPVEAIKAQAIVSRTYALYQATISTAKDFDVTSDVYSQVYGGVTSEKRRTNRAVSLSKGKILIWNNQIFPAYFHATCGGATLASNELWKMEIPPLAGVKCPFCVHSPHFYWKKNLSKSEIIEKLKKAGYFLQDIDGIEITRADPSGRALDLVLFHPQGQLQIAANAFRLALGPNEIMSAFFTFEVEDQKIVFQGKGWGHGVGLCQWGAYAMAKKGYTGEEILSYYYPGSAVVIVR